MGSIYKAFIFFIDTDVYKFLNWVHKILHLHPKLIKKCPNCSRIVPDTDYITHPKTINLKINMLVHTICAPPPTIQQ